MARGGVRIEVEGVRDLVRALQRARGPETRKQFGAANKAIGANIIARARPAAPFDSTDSEHLRDTMRPSASAREVPSGAPQCEGCEKYEQVKTRILIRAGGKRRAPYAPIVHWGSRYRPDAQPFLAETVERMRDQIERDYLSAIERIVRTASAR